MGESTQKTESALPDKTIVNGSTQTGKVMDSKRPHGKLLLVALAPVVLLLAVVAGFCISGHLVVMQKQSNEHALLVTRVCDDATVATYNKVAEFKQRDNSGQDTLDEAGLKSLVADVQGTPNYQGDPTCETIILASAIHNQDYKTAKDAYQVLESLHAKQLYVDSHLDDDGSLPAYKVLVDNLSPTNGDSQEPQGGQ